MEGAGLLPQKILVCTEDNVSEHYCAFLIKILEENNLDNRLYSLLDNDTTYMWFSTLYNPNKGVMIGPTNGVKIGPQRKPSKKLLLEPEIRKIEDGIRYTIMFRMDTLMEFSVKRPPGVLSPRESLPIRFSTRPIQKAWLSSDKKTDKSVFIKEWCDSILALPIL